MILFLVPLLCAVVGLVLYFALRATGAFGVFAGTGGTTTASGVSTPPSGLRERIAAIPSGWLVAVIAVAGLWILGWLVVLAIGLNLLT